MSKQGGRKRTDKQREADLAILGEMIVEGYSMAEILEKINEGKDQEKKLSSQTLYNDRKELLKRWREVQIDSVDDWVSIQMAKIDGVYNKALRGYEDSFKDQIREDEDRAVITAEEDKEEGFVGNEEISERVVRRKVIRTKPTTGNPQFLNVAIKSVSEGNKLLGIDGREMLSRSDEGEGKEFDLSRLSIDELTNYRDIMQKVHDKKALSNEEKIKWADILLKIRG